MKRVIKLFSKSLPISALLLAISSRGQVVNFVTNGGFEERTSCTAPNTGYLFPNVIGWDEINNTFQIAKWNHYCYGAIPFNGFYHNFARSDSAYISIDVYNPEYADARFRRIYARNKLIRNLQAGQTYCVKYYVNVGNNSTCGTDGFGAYFGGDEIDTIVQSHVILSYLNPQIQNPPHNFITDTLGWKELSGTFIANGTEKYMIVGNFNTDAATNSVAIGTPTSRNWATFSVDDVSCIPVDLPAFAGEDTLVMTGDSIFLGRQTDIGIDEACVWYKLPSATPIDTIAGFWVKPTSTETYVVRQEICGNVKYDTVKININGVGLNELYSLEHMHVFPNPASGLLRIEGLTALSGKSMLFQVYNMFGEIIYKCSLEIGRNGSIIDLAGIAEGHYFIECRSVNRYSVRRRIFVTR